MKFLYYTLMILLIPQLALAQVQDRTETNCDGEMRSVHQVGDEGKPLIIATKGLDCSTCMSHAPAVGDFAEDYAGQIEVWGAMTYLYSPNDPTCPAVADWESDYGWTNIFTFLDLAEYWVEGGGLPDYRVIHPQTHEEVYLGPSWDDARDEALELLSLSIANIDNGIQQLSVVARDGQLQLWIDGGNPGKLQVEVLTIIGQRVAEFQTNITSGAQRLEFPFNEKEGVYLLRAIQDGQPVVRKFTIRR